MDRQHRCWAMWPRRCSFHVDHAAHYICGRADAGRKSLVWSTLVVAVGIALSTSQEYIPSLFGFRCSNTMMGGCCCRRWAVATTVFGSHHRYRLCWW